jgi:hypothetical protein
VDEEFHLVARDPEQIGAQRTAIYVESSAFE